MYDPFTDALIRLYMHTSLTLIGGNWKTGKTDFSLMLAETLLKTPHPKDSDRPIIHRIVSNIEVDHEAFDYVSSYQGMKYWCHRNKNIRTLAIVDEANVHFTKRRAVSRANVNMIRLFPELSKTRTRLIMIGQELATTDSEFLNETWLRGVWIKLKQKKVRLISPLIPELKRTFNDVPKTTIDFDPYAIAPFTEKPTGSGYKIFEDDEKQLLWRWSNDTPCRELGIHQWQLNRIVRKFVRTVLEPEAKMQSL